VTHVAEAEREWHDRVANLADADSALQQARAAFREDPSAANGKAFEKAESTHKLATLAADDAAAHIDAARATFAQAQRQQALAELAGLDRASDLAAFNEQISPHVARVLELRAQLQATEGQVQQLVSAFTTGRQTQVLARARELGTRLPPEYLFSEFAKARLAGGSPQPAAFTRESPEPRNFAAELLKVSSRKAAEREQLASI
jgi:hypothetical protein